MQLLWHRLLALAATFDKGLKMADLKISQLTASTTPLAGTEVLPIVQSSSTVKVSVANLTAGRTVSGTTFRSGDGSQSLPAYSFTSSNDSGMFYGAGYTQIATQNATYILAGSAAIYLQYATFLTGNATLSTGNLVQGTAGKGINFTANTNAPGMTSELLNWYEEGTFTPTFTNLTVVGTPTYAGTYTRIGRLVYCRVVVTSTTSTSSTNGSTSFTDLPFTPNGSGICAAADGNTAAGYGNGILAPPNVYTPTWGASSSVTIALTYTT
jgi:hypothetical protein